MLRTITVVLFIALPLAFIAQENGFLRGNIEDGDFGGPLIGTTIIDANNPSVGTVTDFDGNYSLSLAPGTYTINISFISYQSQTFENIDIKSGETTLLDAVLVGVNEQLEEVIVVAKAKRSSSIGMLTTIKNSSNVVDGLSAQSFRKVGDSDLSGAIKRVTGVTVEGGKYVYVRGLGDSYTKTTLNGMAIPGLDPDVNAVQIDIFPTAVLENVSVYKTFTPNLYGDFTGGLVDVVTKSFPEEKTLSVTIGLEYVENQTLHNDFLLYNGGSLDFLGFDDGTRNLPIDPSTNIPDPVSLDPELTVITESFQKQLAAQSSTSLPNGSFSFNYGDQKTNKKDATFGYNVILNYKNSSYFYEDYQSNGYLKDNDKSVNEIILVSSRQGIVSGRDVQWSGMLSGAYKKNTNNISLMLLHSQSGESSASLRNNNDYEQTGARLVENILTYTQRSLSTFFISGRHMLGKTKMEWTNAATYSRVYDPDFRTTSISVTGGDTTLNSGDGAGIQRFWRDLHEINENFKLDFSIPLGSSFELKTGANALLKWRTFETNSYSHTRRNTSDISFDPDWYLLSENIWRTDYREGTYTIGNEQPTNNFEASQFVFAAYLMVEQKVGNKLKFIYGLRVEKGNNYYTGENLQGEVFDNEPTLDELDFLPSVNAVWGVNTKMNLRASFTQTIARPSFKEKSSAQIYDPISQRTFIGNIDLNQTKITNYDLRYEWFITPAELFSIAAFYKVFNGHIELVSFPQDPDNLKPRNSGNASVFGVELELRKRFINSGSGFLQKLFIGGNVTVVRSAVDMKSVNVDNTDQSGQALTEYDLRQLNARDGETIDQYRPMAGQSPYAVNANLAYENPEMKYSISLAYNVKGEQLSIIGSGRTPDAYTKPFHSLDFNAYFSVGKSRNHRITISVSNILDQKKTIVYKSYESPDGIFNQYNPGRMYGVKYTFSL